MKTQIEHLRQMINIEDRMERRKLIIQLVIPIAIATVLSTGLLVSQFLLPVATPGGW